MSNYTVGFVHGFAIAVLLIANAWVFIQRAKRAALKDNEEGR